MVCETVSEDLPSRLRSGHRRQIAKLTALIVGASVLSTVTIDSAEAGDWNAVGLTQGSSPFINYVTIQYSGTLTSAGFAILPKAGSYTRPIQAFFTGPSLRDRTGPPYLYLPVFGLYANTTNYVSISLTFSDGTNVQKFVAVPTQAYVDNVCPQSTVPQVMQNRSSTNDLPFDYVLVKNSCSPRTPSIFDTDGNLRWVGPSRSSYQHAINAVAFNNNSIYASDGGSGMQLITLDDGQVAWTRDFSSYVNDEGQHITTTYQHNIDIGRNGNMLVGVDTANELESNILEFNSAGVPTELWDMSSIVSNAISRLGGNSGGFVPPPVSSPQNPLDWFHMNSAAYWRHNGRDYLLVSSRESGVFAVTYDPQTTSNNDPSCPLTPGIQGIQNLCWVLGDDTKQWYPYLGSYSLYLASQATYQYYAPIGQHGISIDSVGNLLLMNNGLRTLYSGYSQFPGYDRNYSFVVSFSLSPETQSAAPQATYFPNPGVYTNICGSVYDYKGAHLVNFANAGPYGAGTTTVPTEALIQTFGPYDGATSKFVFSLAFQNSSPQQTTAPFNACQSSWNAVPIDLSLILYQ